MATKTNAVGILATKGTLSSALFHKTSNEFAKGVNAIEQVGTGLVPLIESGKVDSEEMYELLTKLLAPMLKANIDYLVLGCSHYPYLINPIRKIVGDNVTIIDSGFAVAKQTQRILEKQNLLNSEIENTTHQLFTNSDPEVLRDLLGEIYESEVKYLEF